VAKCLRSFGAGFGTGLGLHIREAVEAVADSLRAAHFRKEDRHIREMAALPADTNFQCFSRIFEQQRDQSSPLGKATCRISKTVFLKCAARGFWKNDDFAQEHEVGFKYRPQGVRRTYLVRLRNSKIWPKFPSFRHLCSHKPLKLMKILTQTSNLSLERSKSDKLPGHVIPNLNGSVWLIAPRIAVAEDLYGLGAGRLAPKERRHLATGLAPWNRNTTKTISSKGAQADSSFVNTSDHTVGKVGLLA